MNSNADSSEEILELISRHASGRIPPLIDTEDPKAGLIDVELFKIYQVGFRQMLSSALGLQLAPDEPNLLETKWSNAKNLSLETTIQGWTKFCATLRGNRKGDEECIKCDRFWAAKAEEAGCAIGYMCVHGMIDLAVPISVNDETIAVAFTGQMFPKPGTVWNPELVEKGGVFKRLPLGESGVDAWTESLERIHRAEQEYGFSDGDLYNLLYENVEQEVTPEDVDQRLKKLDSLGQCFSELATVRLEAERGKIRSWIRNGISYSLAQLEVETSGSVATTIDFRGVENESFMRVWKQMAEYLEHVCRLFGFAHLVVLACDYWNGGGTITLLSHYGRSSKEFPFPSQYDCARWSASLEALHSEMFDWRTATIVDLEKYANLPVIRPLYNSLGRRRSTPIYAVSRRFVTGIAPILVLGSLDYRKRSLPLSQLEMDEFTMIGTEIGLVANISNLVMDLHKATEQQGRFIEDVAHDIRNPIQNLLSLAEYIDIQSLPIEAKVKTARNIAAEVRRINELSERVWVLEDLRRGLLDLGKGHSVQVFEVIKRCQKSLRHRAVQAEVDIWVDPELQNWPRIRVNEDLFYHTVLNLMDNAVKYSLAHTEVRVRGEVKPREYELIFGNIGIGVPDDEKELIFKRHYRAKNAQRKIREGTGIGLSIVKVFADYYGSIELESRQLDSGDHLTRFHLKIRREQLYD